jgi:PAS domain S-box-containing protein
MCVLEVNRAGMELFGSSRETLIGLCALSMFADSDRSECRRQIESGQLGEKLRIVRDAETRFFEMVVSRNIAQDCHLLVLRDRTERQRETQSERYRALWQRARDIVLFIDQNGRILDANDAAVEAYGLRESLIGVHVEQLRAPHARAGVDEQLGMAFAHGLLFETVHIRADGRHMPVEVSSRATTIGGETVLVSVIRDITERKLMQTRLVEADRLASVGTLAAGVAHEINNPLAYVMTSLEVASRVVRRAADDSMPSLSRAAELLATALHGAERVRAIVRDLKTLARTDDEETAVDVRSVIDACLDVAQHELRQRVDLVREYGDVPTVRANEGRLAQVFLNLIVNAAHAVRAAGRERGTVHIETARDIWGRVVVKVSDNGTGIDPEMMPRIFDAFVTTKRAGEGTGLGLYLSRSIVNALGGEIHAESELGRGSTFVVTLAAGSPSKLPSPNVQLQISRSRPVRRARVLLVDDEIAIGAALRAALEEEHELLVLASAEAAIEWLRDDDLFDLVLTDISMPGLSGLDLLAHIREYLPGLATRVVLMSGGALPSGVTESALADVPVLEKPFAVEAIRNAICTALSMERQQEQSI